MATKLDDLSVAIGALQEGQRRAEQSRVEHADTVRKYNEHIAQKLSVQNHAQEANFKELSEKLEALAISIDSKVEKATKRVMHGAVGGAGIVILQYVASKLGIKIPFGF
jgi:hypothetical protein